MARRQRRPLWHLALSAVLVSCAVSAALYLHWEATFREDAVASQDRDARRASENAAALGDRIASGLGESMAELGIGAELVERRADPLPPSTARYQFRVRVPGDLPLATVNLQITRLVRAHGGSILRAVEYEKTGRVLLHCGLDTIETATVELLKSRSLQRRAGKIAIVIDDFGHTSQRLVKRFCQLPFPLTLAVLPNEGQADAIVERALATGHEVLVHLPMEPNGYPDNDPGPGAVMVEQDADEIRWHVRRAIAHVPGAVGLNNHMGSRATADPRVMGLVLDEVARHPLFFLDSRTTPDSQGWKLAQEVGVPCVQRDLFIDPLEEVTSVEENLWELAELAARNGHAVGVGHDRQQTLSALEYVLPRLERRGFRFVPVSQLAQ
jgi:polysaccharide deacetylase 2 family uncharacterized protein YibQ